MKRRAFTLLEVLVVITIIGVLTSLLVLNFQGVKERQELALLADKSLALLQQAKAEVRSGRVVTAADGAVSYLCEGAYFKPGGQVEFAAAPFVAKAAACDFDALELEDYALTTGAAAVDSVLIDGIEEKAVLVLFVPPEAELQLFDNKGNELGTEAEVIFGNSDFSSTVEFAIGFSELTDFAQLLVTNLETDEE